MPRFSAFAAQWLTVAALAVAAAGARGQSPFNAVSVHDAESVTPVKIAQVFSDGSVGQWHPYVVNKTGEDPAASSLTFGSAETTQLHGPGPEFVPTDGAECGGFEPTCNQACSRTRRLLQSCAFTYGGIRISATSSANSRGERGNVGQVFVAWSNKRGAGELDDFNPPRVIGDTVIEVLIYDNWFDPSCGPAEPNLVGGVLVNFGPLAGKCGADTYYYSTINLREFEDVCMTIPGPMANFGYEVAFWYDANRTARAANNQAVLWGTKDSREQGHTLDVGYADLDYNGQFTPPGECLQLQGGGCPSVLAAAVDFWGDSSQGTLNLWDNGTFVTEFRTGCNGWDISVRQTPGIEYGFPTQPQLRHQADDMTVPAGQVWQVQQMRWYLFQPNASEQEPLVSAFVRVWDGPPGAGGSIIAGDMTTNRLIGSQFADTYRVPQANPTECPRAVKQVSIDMTWLPNLTAGTYWFELASAGNLSFPGPLAVPTVPRNELTDNSRSLDVTTNTWSANSDNGLPVDFPFELDGKIISGGGCDISQYTLTVNGTCPGTVTIAWANAAPRSQQGIVYGARLGTTIIPPGSACAGTTLGIRSGVRLITVVNTGQTGNGSINGNASSGACRGYLQLVESRSCRTSNVAQLP